MSLEYAVERQRVADAGRLLLNEGLVARTWGNVSCRTGADAFVITPSGLGYEHMSAEDVVPFDMNLKTWTGSHKPSSEKGIHTAAYRRFPDAGFVVHTHQTGASATGLAGFDRLELAEEERGALGGLRLADYGLPGTKTLAKRVTVALESGAHTVLMAHHGALIVGRDAEEAFARVRLLETICRRALQGQPEAAETADAAALTAAAMPIRGFAAAAQTSAVVTAAARGTDLPAELDDMAQMIGAKMPCVPADKALRALEKYDAVLVPGFGALVSARTAGDAEALCLLVEKACICWLHTNGLGVDARLPWLDTHIMRTVYVKKYEKQIGGNYGGKK